MQTTITARHCEISDGLRDRAQAVVERLGSIAPRAMESTVVFDSEGTQQTAELRLHVAGGEILVARGEGPIIARRSTAPKSASAASSSGPPPVPGAPAPQSPT
jgi:hypothetical protein